MTTKPVIGDFRSTPDNKPRVEAPAEIPEPPAVTDADVSEVVKELQEEADRTPVERYRARLKAAGVTLDEAEGIFDAVFTKGYYEEYVKLGRGQSRRGVFRTRQHEDTLRVQKALELEQPSLNVTQNALINRYNLAASLYEWDGRALKHDTDQDFDALLNLVRRLPDPIVSLLTQELAKFDRKTLVVFSDGAVENFS